MVKKRVNEWLEVSSSDPDIQRRAKLLNIILSSLFALILVAVVGVIIANIAGIADTSGVLAPSAFMLLAVVVVYFINRYWSTSAASALFLFILTIILTLFAAPYETVWGRNMIMFALPVIMASVIMRPLASFLVAGMIALLFLGLSYMNGFQVNFVGTLVYFLIAVVAWLAASTLENALGELRIINTELDAIVDERTKELVLANTKLTEARDTAIDASKYKSELTARVSHEMRTPLGAILGYSEMLRGGHYGPINEEQKGKLNSIAEMTKNLSNLIGDWLDQAKLEAGKMDLNMDWFDVRDTLAYVKGITEVLIKDKAIVLNYNVDGTVPTLLYGDKERVQQILINLMGNAIKYTKRGTVSAHVFLAEDNHWVIEVKDTGIGIPKQSLSTIFDSFSQVDGSRTREHEGFGLGLSIVHHLTDLMDGDIEVESEVGVGSVFQVILPLINKLELA